MPSAHCPGLSRSHPPSAPCLVSGQESPVPAESASLLAPVIRAVCVCMIPSSCGFSSLSPFMGWALSQGYFIWCPWDPGFTSMDELQRSGSLEVLCFISLFLLLTFNILTNIYIIS